MEVIPFALMRFSGEYLLFKASSRSRVGSKTAICKSGLGLIDKAFRAFVPLTEHQINSRIISRISGGVLTVEPRLNRQMVPGIFGDEVRGWCEDEIPESSGRPSKVAAQVRRYAIFAVTRW